MPSTNNPILIFEARARVEAWNAESYGWTGMTNGQWMAKLPADQLLSIRSLCEGEMASLGGSYTSVTMSAARSECRRRLERVEYEIERRTTVRTRSGCPVRILCTDAKTDHPIVGLLIDTDTGVESVETWAANGAYALTGERDEECALDLVLLPKPPAAEQRP